MKPSRLSFAYVCKVDQVGEEIKFAMKRNMEENTQLCNQITRRRFHQRYSLFLKNNFCRQKCFRARTLGFHMKEKYENDMHL